MLGVVMPVMLGFVGFCQIWFSAAGIAGYCKAQLGAVLCAPVLWDTAFTIKRAIFSTTLPSQVESCFS